MRAVAELREQVAASLAAQAAQKNAALAAALEEFRQMVRAALGEELLVDLAAAFEIVDATPVVAFFYRDERLGCTAPGRYAVSGYAAHFPERDAWAWLARWLDEVDALLVQRAQRQAQFWDEFEAQLPAIDRQARLQEWARRAHDLHLAGTERFLALQARCAQQIAQRDAEQDRLAAERLERAVAQMLTQIASATTIEELHGVPAAVAGYPAVQEQYAARKAALLAAAEAQEQARAALQTEAFFPFEYYLVTYGAADHSCGPENVDCYLNSFETLRPEPQEPDGWWVTATDRRLKVACVITIERFTVLTPAALPYWCPWIETEYGDIQAPPVKARALSMLKCDDPIIP